MDKHYLGSFNHIDEVYEIYPSGGSHGDYIILDNALVLWNDNQRIWGNFKGFEPISGIETQIVEGNLNVGNNLRVGNEISAKTGRFGKIIAEQIEFDNNPFAASNHKHTEYANKRHQHLLADIKDLLDYVDEALNESGFSLIKMWQALDTDSDHQINISHLESIIDYFKDEFLSRNKDDFAKGNITFKKKIDVADRATFRKGAIFLSDYLPEEIHEAVIEPESDKLDDYIVEESTNKDVIATGYVEEGVKN